MNSFFNHANGNYIAFQFILQLTNWKFVAEVRELPSFYGSTHLFTHKAEWRKEKAAHLVTCFKSIHLSIPFLLFFQMHEILRNCYGSYETNNSYWKPQIATSKDLLDVYKVLCINAAIWALYTKYAEFWTL